MRVESDSDRRVSISCAPPSFKVISKMQRGGDRFINWGGNLSQIKVDFKICFSLWSPCSPKRIWTLRIPSAEWASRINRNRQLLLSVPPSLLNNAHLLRQLASRQRQLASLPRQRQHLPPPCRLSSCLKSQSWGRTNFAGKASALGLLLSKRILDLTSTLKTGWGNKDNYGGDDYHDIDKISARREMSRWKGQGCNDLRNLSLWTLMGSC